MSRKKKNQQFLRIDNPTKVQSDKISETQNIVPNIDDADSNYLMKLANTGYIYWEDIYLPLYNYEWVSILKL